MRVGDNFHLTGINDAFTSHRESEQKADFKNIYNI